MTHRHLRAQNLFCWSPPTSSTAAGLGFGLIALSTLVDFFVGIRIEKADPGRAKAMAWVSLAVNLGILGYFKYANFFIEN